MPPLQHSTSQASIQSVDSFIDNLNIDTDGEFIEWCQTLKTDDGKSLLGQRKQLSHDNKQRPENARGRSKNWSDDMKNDYEKYKEQSDDISTKKKEFDKSKEKLKKYKNRGGTEPQRLRELLNDCLTKADSWADAGVGGCKKRLKFMEKFQNVFSKASTTGHIEQAEVNLRSARLARTETRALQT
ncbi:hypothetical protein F4859DRAFT_512964 [Xylaria cf. heliscus]|nr:hypothetical protein F4859DRAFT_512964 [Xylaria cf. heliscus]